MAVELSIILFAEAAKVSPFSDSNNQSPSIHSGASRQNRQRKEVQFFESLPISLWKEDVDEHDLEPEPYNIDKQVVPVDVLQSDGIDERAWKVPASNYQDSTIA